MLFSQGRDVGKRDCACLCMGRSKPGGELLPLHCKLFGGELIHFLGSGISYSLNTFLFSLLLVQQDQRHKRDKCGTDFLWLTCLFCLPCMEQNQGRARRWLFALSALFLLFQTMSRTWSNRDKRAMVCLDVVWVAFETVSLLAVVGGEADCGFKTESLLNQLGSWTKSCLPGDVSVSALC